MAPGLGWIEADEVLDREEELCAEPQRGEPVVDADRIRQRADTGDIHEPHLHAAAHDIVEFAGERHEGDQRKRRQRGAFLDTGEICARDLEIVVPGAGFRRELAEHLLRRTQFSQLATQGSRKPARRRRVRCDHPARAALVQLRREHVAVEILGVRAVTFDQAAAGRFVIDFPFPVVHGHLVEEILVAEDRQHAPKRLLERPVGGGAPGGGRIAGFDPSKVKLSHAVADDGDRGRPIRLAAQDGDAQIDDIDRVQDFTHGGIEHRLDVAAGFEPRTGSRILCPGRGAASDHPVMGRQRRVEDRRDIGR
ncbi:hypothetical protein A8V01_13455 [Novosphingobium guangzhouense]|uniref:Uncharacterized protein n=1 Tax=Novosphingobium guangzhouense TaxID=1850347 RepID=A0A2K2G4V6_9SPHN|nr:hypothetical protein A8V01_13455 [Novosphingobium guangzhouense]